MITMNKKLLFGMLTAVILAATAVSVTLVVLEFRNPVIDYEEHDPIVIWGDEDFNNYDFSGRGTEKSPYMISGYNITTSSNIGISIWNTNKYFIIENCYIDAELIGISVESIKVGTPQITNNICNMNSKIGILVYFSPQISIINNLCNYNGYGIVIDSSSSCLVTDNTCEFNEIGIVIHYSSLALVEQCEIKYNYLGLFIGYSTSTTVQSCKINDNNEGISILESPNTDVEVNDISSNSYGVIIMKSRSSTIQNNVMNYNYYGIYAQGNTLTNFANNTIIYNAYGIYFKVGVDSNTICFNYFELNYVYAIKIESSNDNNAIHRNAFLNNSALGISQAYDDGMNIWYDFYTNTGNYYNDWSGIGSYAIAGAAGNSDPYPLETSPLT